MSNASMGINVNVQITERDRRTGSITNRLSGHNRITSTGIGLITDYISAHFDSGNLLNFTNSELIENKDMLIEKFRSLLMDLPYQVILGTNNQQEGYLDSNIKNAIKDPITNKPISLKLSNGASVVQSALQGSLISVQGYEFGKTVSLTTLSRSDTFENFPTNTTGIILDQSGNVIQLGELVLMSKSNKCWARIAFSDDKNLSSMSLNKNKVYDIVWNINLVSINTQLVDINS